MKKNSTKEKIFNISIDLFSNKGYNEVTVREIAKCVGIKESSIYNHFSNKEAILDEIFNYFIENMSKTETTDENYENLLNENPKKLYQFGSEKVKFQFKKPKMLKILRLVFIEMFRNEKIKKFFLKELIEGPIAFWREFFQNLINKNIIKKRDPQKLAEYYYNYGIYKMYELSVIKYPEKLNYESIFDELEEYFNFIIESLIEEDLR